MPRLDQARLSNEPSHSCLEVVGNEKVMRVSHALVHQDLHVLAHHLFHRVSNYLSFDSKSITAKDRAVYKAAYSGENAIRAGNAWYQAFTQDAIDMKSYRKLDIPVLALGATGYEWLKASLPSKVNNFKLVRVENSGHYMAEENPAFVAAEFEKFFD